MTMADARQGKLSRIDLAKEGAIQAVRTVQLGEYVGVMAFDFTPYWAVPLRQLRTTQDIQDAVIRISLISADGGTNIYQALRDARLAIARTQAQVKHIVLLSDGESSEDRFSSLLSRIRQDGITVSTVAVGSDAGTALLESIAQAGQGRYYFTSTPDNIPQIMTQRGAAGGAVAGARAHVYTAHGRLGAGRQRDGPAGLAGTHGIYAGQCQAECRNSDAIRSRRHHPGAVATGARALGGVDG